MEKAVIIFNDGIRNKDDIFSLFEASDVNVEGANIRNWDALEEILRDSVNIYGIRVSIFGFHDAKIDSYTRRLLMDILESECFKVSGAIKVEF